MLRTLPIPLELWEQIPLHVRAVLKMGLESYEQR
jgi:hypothetical protein